jgi:protein gp37
MIFVNSMSDLFHDDVPDEYIIAVFEVMFLANWHVYQVLTKRADRMQRMIANELRFAAKLEHIWWGTTVENRKHGLPRIEALRNSDVATRFLSCEPLLEDFGVLNLDGIDWLIAGGESGPGARPMQPEWAISLRDQCSAEQVPFFFKQWGGFPKSKYGCLLEGKQYKAIPPLPIAFPASRFERRTREAVLLAGFNEKGIAA